MSEQKMAHHSSFRQQLKATLVRNLRLKIRDSRKTLMEILIPLYTLGTLIVLKVLIPNPNFPAILEPRGDGKIFEHFNQMKNHTIAVLPHGNTSRQQTTQFLTAVNAKWQSMRPVPGMLKINWQIYDTQEELLSAYWRHPYSMPLALVFHGDDPMNGQLNYEIRTNPSFFIAPLTTQLYSSPVSCRETESYWSSVIPIEMGDSCPVNQYYYSGFIALQTLLDYTKISLASNTIDFRIPNIHLEMFPKEAYTGNWLVAFRLVIPIYMVMALSQFITYLLILIVGEKEKHIKEGLKIMGLRDSVFWLAWFVIYGLFVAFLSVVSVVLLFTLGVLHYTNYFPVFLLILLYSLSVILIGFMLTPFFDNSRTAGILGNFIVNIMSLFYFIQVFLDHENTSLTLWFVSLISPTGFALAMDKILVLDISGQGVTLENLWSGPGIPLGGSILMMAVDIVLYGFLSYYLDMVVPSEHGTKQKPFFCFMPSFWRTKKEPKMPLLNGNLESTVNSFNTYEPDIEPVPREMRGREAIKIVDLVKTFNSCRGKQVTAINGINLTIYEGQITAILGKNGAGKSTLFNILTGLTLPSNGTAYIFGYDVRDPNDMTMIRRMTGVCPQHDILFDDLSPKEHLFFTGAVRGISESTLDAEVKKTLKDCDLFEMADQRVKHLSGGQKRKLSVGIAIIGDPKIVILDEPTAGVDPYSRRSLWGILQTRKQGKVILITTHFMDEADILADRKAVISRGRLRCCGSSLFLKNKFGIGYHLTLVLDPKAKESSITNLVNLHVAKAEKGRHHGRELSYILPHDAVINFAPLFNDIEGPNGTQLGILSYGVSMTTLEEVFLHLETSRDNEDYETSAMRIKMVQSRAVSRSMSLQGRSGSSTSVIIETMDVNGKGTIRSLPERKSIAYAVDANDIETSDEPPLIRINHDANDTHNDLQNKSSWAELDDINLEPSIGSTIWALLIIRCTILIRDLQRLYLMIVVPLLFTGIGLYLNSIQVVTPVMRSITLDNNTYAKDGARIAVHFRDFSFDLDSSGRFESVLNRAIRSEKVVSNRDFDETLLLAPVGGPGDYIDDSADAREFDATLNFQAFIDELTKITEVDDYDGGFATLLNVSSHMAAVNVTSFADNNITITVLYNDTTQHSLPVVLNMITNAIYRVFSGSSDIQPIEIRSHPFQQTAQPQEFNIGTFSSALFVGMIFVLVPVSLAVDMVYDREMKAKNQLRVNGLTTSLYFVAYFIVMAGLMILICAALLLMIFIMDIPSFKQPAALITLAILVILYSPSAILCSTVFSYFFNRTDSALSFLPNILTFVGLIPFILVAFLDMMGIDVKATIALHYVFSILNPMYIPYALVYFVDRVYIACNLSSACANLSFINYMTEEIIVMIVSVLLHIPIWSLCLRIVDIKKNGGKINDMWRRKIESEDVVPAEECVGEFEDDDVKMERERVLNMCSANNADDALQPVVIVKNLRKEFKQSDGFCPSMCCSQSETANKPRVAVRCLSLSVDPGEVLGFLGHNGAGKTTTMKIITGEMAPSKGQVKIGGYNITNCQSDAFKMLGYCPQHDALWKNVTVREHIELYAAIRGIPVKDRKRLINTYLHGLHISEHANKLTKEISGGTKRKLSYVIAMLGAPKVVLLDEPSTGMDPKSKRFLWDTILASFQGTRGAILTTHSMEEADALCSRVGIMVKGELRCLGSTQHLKNLYGAGYNLEIKIKQCEGIVNSSSFENIQVHAKKQCRSFVSELFPDARVEESFGDRIVCSIPQHNVSSLAQSFESLEKAKVSLGIEEYSFSQTTLEQVFLKLAHYDEETTSEVRIE